MKKTRLTDNRIVDKRPAVAGLPVAALSVVAMVLSCVVPADPPDVVLHFAKTGSVDTIAPFDSVRIAFSRPSSDTAVPLFTFSPPSYTCTVVMNRGRDTASVSWAEPLAGAMRYVMRIETFITAGDGPLSSPDSVVFFTWPVEREPNAVPATADTLRTVRWGTVAMVDDTDWFVIAEGNVSALVLNSIGSQTSFAVMSNGRLPSTDRSFRPSDTLRIEAAAGLPLHIAVFAAFRSVGGYYELRRIVSGK